MNRELLFGDNFKKYRKKRGISQKEFAHMLYQATGKKLTLTSVSNYETGMHMPPPQILPSIAEILEVTIDALFGKEEEVAAPAEVPLAEDVVKEWKTELEYLERKYITWKATSPESESLPVTEFCEDLISIARKQQDELTVLQTELATIRELLGMFKGKL